MKATHLWDENSSIHRGFVQLVIISIMWNKYISMIVLLFFYRKNHALHFC